MVIYSVENYSAKYFGKQQRSDSNSNQYYLPLNTHPGDVAVCFVLYFATLGPTWK